MNAVRSNRSNADTPQHSDTASAGPTKTADQDPTRDDPWVSALDTEDPKLSDTIDRFRLQRKLGAGGMGTVYEGWDDKLQRTVALKFLTRFSPSQAHEHRFLREAQGLAQLSHPNVVSVYDVGRHAGRVWIAMEFVPGRTLGEWVEAEPRSRDAILGHWIAAARGLAAIHDAGLVHRDIKPANVLLGDDGRVRVIDLGLVKVAETVDPEDSAAGVPTVDAELTESVTSPHVFVGTPAYAAPEHFDGRWVDARSDQFSLCVALWQALIGERPSRERNKHGLVPLPEGKRLPRYLHRTLSRGLALDPRDRFASVHELVAALQPRRRRWVVPAISAVVTASAALAVGLLLLPQTEAPPAPCAQATAPIDAIWTETRRRNLTLHLPAAAAAESSKLLDAWAEEWSASATSSCEDTHVRQLYSHAVLDARGLCLDRTRDGFEALLLAVEAGTVDSPHAMLEWFAALEQPRECLDEVVARASYVLEPIEQREELATLRRQLVSMSVSSSGSLSERIAVVSGISERADELGFTPLRGETALILGVLHMKARDLKSARAAIGHALDLGTEHADIELIADAWSTTVRLETHYEFDAERAWWAHGRERALFEDREPSRSRRARMIHDRGVILELEGRHDEAIAALREAASMYASLGPTLAWTQAGTMRDYANALVRSGQADEALGLFAEARVLELQLGEDVVDPAGLSEGSTILNEGIALVGSGDYAEARTALERGLALAIEEEGPRGELVARMHVALAGACEGLGDLEGLRTHAQQADEISLAAVGPTNLLRIDVLSAVGGVALLVDEQPEAAVEAFEQALIIARRHTAEDSLQVALAERNLALGLHAAGKRERAAKLAEHALAALERSLGAEHPVLASVLVVLGEIALERDESDAARAALDRALTLLAGSSPEEEARLRGLLDQLPSSSP